MDELNFPLSLYCSDIPKGLGPTWGGISLGTTPMSELNKRSDFDHFDEFVFPDGQMFGEIGDRRVFLCVRDGIISAFVIPGEDLYIDDLLAIYGEPDAISFQKDTENHRLIFWFKYGIAVQMFVYDQDKIYNGSIVAVIFFPYQDITGFVARWPYNRTCGTTFCGQTIFGIEPTELNPFDFESILLTMTAEPTRTPTTTFTPYQTPTSTANFRSATTSTPH